jgi:hypothetical protein
VSFREIPVDGSEPFEPLGREPLSITVYTPDGYMSAQLSKPDRPDFASGDWPAAARAAVEVRSNAERVTMGDMIVVGDVRTSVAPARRGSGSSRPADEGPCRSRPSGSSA